MKKVKFLLIITSLVLSTFLLLLTIPAVNAQEEWENVGLEWFYDNLTDEDRQKIRQAIDYCIPRQQIIDGLMHGYAVPLATEVGQNMLGYDDSIQPRDNNVTKAGELLADVFGKTYDISQDPSDIYTDVPYFHMTLISPTTNVARTQWASMISYALNNVGIETELKWWNWNIIMPRLFLDPKTDPLGANYEHGGFDAYFIGFGATADPDYSGQYYPESFPPAGDNSMYIERPDLVEIINRSLTSPNLEDRLKALSDYQYWFYDWVPKCIIRQEEYLFASYNEWTGLDTYNYGRYPWVHNMTQTVYDPTATFTSVVPGAFVDFNPLISNSWYDSVWQSNVYLTLAGRRGMYNLSHPYPLLADSWERSADNLEWTVTLREGVTFHDGTEMTAEDVIYSYEAAYDCPTSTIAGDMANWFDPNATWIEKGSDDYTVKFTLKTFHPYVESGIFGGIPILSKAQMETIGGYENWKTDGTNTGSEQLYGTGPYAFTSYNPTEGVICDKYDDWDSTLMGHNPSAVGGGIWLDNTYAADKHIVVVNLEATSSVTGLKNGAYQLLDPNVGIHAQIDDVLADENLDLITTLEYGWQELAFNHYDPRWGLNPHDPRELYPEDYEDTPLEILPVILALFGFATFQLIRRRKK